MEYHFSWRDAKAEINLRKHHVDFEDEVTHIHIISARKATKHERKFYENRGRKGMGTSGEYAR